MNQSVRLLENKITLITGTSKGIGKKLVEEFCRQGAIVVANSKELGDNIDEFCRTIGEEYDTECIPAYFDVTDSKAAKDTFLLIKKKFNKLDVLVNNAGIMQDAILGMITKKQMEETFGVNVFAMIEMMQFAEKLMSRQGGGSIINMASIVGRYGNPGQSVYSASKGAVIALTKTAAKELAAKQIRVNAVAPGMIDTEMFRSIGKERIEKRLEMIGMGRLGTPQDISEACVFLASDMSSYITGEVLGVAGGALI